MGILDTIKNWGGNILNSGRNIGGNIMTGIDTIRDKIRGITRKARSIPFVDKMLKTKLPVLGESLDQLGSFADDAIDAVKDVGRNFGIRSAKDRMRDAD